MDGAGQVAAQLGVVLLVDVVGDDAELVDGVAPAGAQDAGGIGEQPRRDLVGDGGAQGIRVLSVVPGWIMTERQLELWVTPETEKDIYANQCLKQPLMPDHIAAMALFLAGPAGRSVSGQSLSVCAGVTTSTAAASATQVMSPVASMRSRSRHRSRRVASSACSP